MHRQETQYEKLHCAFVGLVPIEPAHKIVCQHNEHTAYTEEGMSAVEPCQHFDQGTLLQKQYLFSVYVHSSRLDGWTVGILTFPAKMTLQFCMEGT